MKNLKTLRVFLVLILTMGALPLPAQALTSIDLTVDVSANRKPISPYIYGLNFAKPAFASEIALPVRRWGGNATSRYNWQTGNSNTAMDWYYENFTVTNAYDWNADENHNAWIAQNIATATDSLITIPMLGYVAKNNSSCGFSVAKYGAQQDADYWQPDCGNGVHTNATNVTGNNPLDTSLAVDQNFMKSWVQNLVSAYGSAGSGGVRFYALDNEPELWSDTHRDVHPAPETYAELMSKTLAYAPAIKSADPNAKLFGYVAFGWSGYWYSWNDLEVAAQNGYTYFPDYATHGNLYQVEWYLDQLRQYEQGHNLRLLDYLDLHYYPESGVALTTAGGSAMQALRLRSTRSLWDPTYRDESWIGGDDQAPDMRYVRLIPRMHDWVNTYYPGTKLSITEYNFGGLESLNGALAQADVLGIFGREDLDFATLWNYPNPGGDPLGYDHFETLPGAYAFRIYRNYDGAGSKFGDTSLQALSADQSQLAIYAAQRTSDSAVTLIIINKTGATLTGNVALSGFTPDATAQVYRYSASNLSSIVRQADQAVTSNGFSASFPANSITLVILPGSGGGGGGGGGSTWDLLAPADGSSINYNRPAFDWEDYAGATGYNIQIAKNSSFVSTSLVTNTTVNGATASEYTPSTDLPSNTLLYWRVRPKLTSTTYGAYSSVWSFTSAAPPSVPSLVAPASGALVSGPSPLFDWSNSTLAAGVTFDRYQIQIATDSAFTNIIHDHNLAGITNSLDNDAALSPATTYYWRVRSFAADGDTSAWSSARSVKIKYLPPSLLGPADYSSVLSLKPNFTWSAVTGATGYTIQISKSLSFGRGTLTANPTLTTYAPGKNLLAHTTYYWRVRANGTYGPSAWSAVFRFTTP